MLQGTKLRKSGNNLDNYETSTMKYLLWESRLFTDRTKLTRFLHFYYFLLNFYKTQITIFL